jgi:YYY domain-containing protein
MQSVPHSIRRSARSTSTWTITLLLIVLAALALRLYGLDWDDGADLHPDELFVARIVLIDRIRLDWPPRWEPLLDPARSGLNPRSADPATGKFREFAYGALPLWVTDAVAWGLSRVTGVNWNAADRAYLVGRSLSALLGALTVVPVAVLGRAVGGRRVGLLAALFAALAPMSIQLAHFFTTDSWLTFFVAWCLVACVAAAGDGRKRAFALAGACFGLAMATKGSVFTLAVPIATAVVIDLLRRLPISGLNAAALAAASRAGVSALAAFAAFFAFEPFALLRPDVYLQSLRTQADIVAGTFDVPFTRVYVGTTPVLYQLEHFVRWGYGPVAGILALLGLVSLVSLSLRSRSVAALVMLSWLTVYGVVLAVAQVKFLRYLEPLTPVLAVAAALALVRLPSLLRRPSSPWLPGAATAAALVLAALWTAAFMTVYAGEHPRLAATRWLYAAAPPGSTLTAEYWDDALPRALGFTLSPAAFGLATHTLDLYRDLPRQDASEAIYAGIADADYVVQSSQRVAAAVAAAPWRYPVQDRFFDQLAHGALGFAPAAEFRRPPATGSLVFDDRAADESFLNYDHPNATIYGRTASPDRARFDAAMSWALGRPWFPARAPPHQTLLLDGPVGENPAVADARWSAAWSSSTPVALAIWIVLLVALLVIGLPIAASVMGVFPDRGWGLARTLALLVAAYPVWLGASLELVRFRAVWVILALVVIGVAGWRNRQAVLNTVVDGRSRTARLHAEAVFWLVFLFFLTLRLLNPDGWHPLWGGEKAMEFAQINAIGRSAYFPPYDPWYADGYVNYYYYGFYLIAFLLKATGIPAEVGFNLALPTVMAMLASGGFSVAAALARGLTRSPRLALLGGWLGAFALSLAGNLSVLRGIAADGAGSVDPFIHWTWNGSRAIDGAITEFPFFTGLYADLHAHVVALPLTVAAIGLCLALVVNTTAGRKTGRPDPRFITNLLLIALVLGSLSATNAWDVPVYALLALAAIIMATAAVTPWARRMTVVVAASLLAVGGAWLLFLPFHRHFVALFQQLALVRDPTDPLQFLGHVGGFVAIAAIGLTALLAPPRSPVLSGLAPWVATALVLSAIAVLSNAEGGTVTTVGMFVLVAGLAGPPLAAAASAEDTSRSLPAWLFAAAAVTAVVVAIAALLLDRAVFALFLVLGIAAAIGWIRLRPRAGRFTCLLLAAGFFTGAGVELVVVADDLLGSPAYRMNTVFKFYNQIWVLFTLACAALVALMAQQLVSGLRRQRPGQPESPALAWSRASVLIAAIVLIASLSYPLLATGPRLAQRFDPGTPTGTLDALAWMEQGQVPSFANGDVVPISYDGDAEAIAWFWRSVPGSPVVAEASIGPYRCNGSRISAATGLPTIIGWERHQQQQRDPGTLPARVEDVRRLYISADPAEKEAILRRYNVAYVVVGDLERRYPLNDNDCTPTGSAAGIAAFDAMLGETLEVAFAADGTTVYRVLPVAAG